MMLIDTSAFKVVLVAIMLCASGCMPSFANDTTLSREESIGALFLVADSEFKVLMFANPSALPTFRRVVMLYPDLPAKTAWSAIGCVGTEHDVSLIRRILETESRGKRDSEKSFNAEAAIKALGLLARRDVPQSRQLLVELQEAKFWEGEAIQFYEGDRGATRSRDEIQALILEAMGRANDSGIAARFEKIYSQIREPERLGFWKHRVQIDRLLKIGKGLDQIEKNGLDVSRREDCLKLFHEIPADKRRLLGLPPGPKPKQLEKLKETWSLRKVKGIEPLPILTGEESDALMKEARAEYKRLRTAIAHDEIMPLSQSLLVKGELIERQYPREELSRAELTQVNSELCNLQSRQKHILKSLEAAMPEETDFTASIETDAGDYSGKWRVVAVVSWKLKGTQEIGRHIIDGKQNIYPTLAEDDNLVVFMKKKDGVWYWNPFGW